MFIKNMVSVYIPTHNRAEMLERAVLSVCKQTYHSIEIIISDDGSSDNTAEIVNRLKQKFENIYYIRSSISEGACSARNKAIFFAKGEFITGLDDDDEFEINRIEYLVSTFKMYENLSFVSSGYKVICKDKVFNSCSREKFINLKNLLNINMVGNQVLTRTEYLRSIGGFDTRFPLMQDYDCWIRLVSKYGKGLNTGKILYIMHTEHDKPRITNKEKLDLGFKLLFLNHKEKMTKNNIKNLNLLYYYFKNNKINLNVLIKNFTFIWFLKYIKNFVKKPNK